MLRLRIEARQRAVPTHGRDPPHERGRRDHAEDLARRAVLVRVHEQRGPSVGAERAGRADRPGAAVGLPVLALRVGRRPALHEDLGDAPLAVVRAAALSVLVAGVQLPERELARVLAGERGARVRSGCLLAGDGGSLVVEARRGRGRRARGAVGQRVGVAGLGAGVDERLGGVGLPGGQERGLEAGHVGGVEAERLRGEVQAFALLGGDLAALERLGEEGLVLAFERAEADAARVVAVGQGRSDVEGRRRRGQGRGVVRRPGGVRGRRGHGRRGVAAGEAWQRAGGQCTSALQTAVRRTYCAPLAGVAQTVRAGVSYALGQGFDSLLRHH